jgi:predicted enzyme related to lactoylglutathione lyase
MTLSLFALCLDANDPPRLGQFWASLLSWDISDNSKNEVMLLPTDDTGFRFRFRSAQEQQAGQKNMHFHLTSTSLDDQQHTVARSLELGARHIDVGQRPEEGHVVLADPEGNEFCVIEPGNKFLAGCGFFAEVTCEGSPQVGYVWSEALGWPLVWDQDLQTAIQSPQGGPKISWDGAGMAPKPRNYRYRFELASADRHDQQTGIDRLISVGATLVDTGQGDVVMADPDGHKFCLLSPSSAC